MSAEASPGEFVSLASRLRDVLLATGLLTPEGALRVEEAMRSMELGFDEAAVQLGLITPEQLAAAFLMARQLPSQASEGIFAGAIHRLAASRRLPVKYVGIVKAGPSLSLVHDPYSSYSEQIRSLRTELVLLNGGSPSGNVIAVLSACQGEGRTQLCAELAIAFSQLGQRTLLIDADLRRPRVHTLFETRNSVGLGQALKLNAAPVLLEVERLPHLCVLIAGHTLPNPLELLSNGYFQSLMSDWRQTFPVVIVDTPPISEYADGLAIASFAEQVLIVGRAGSTPHKNVKEMLRRMAGTQPRIVGAVINRF